MRFGELLFKIEVQAEDGKIIDKFVIKKNDTPMFFNILRKKYNLPFKIFFNGKDDLDWAGI